MESCKSEVTTLPDQLGQAFPEFLSLTTKPLWVPASLVWLVPGQFLFPSFPKIIHTFHSTHKKIRWVFSDFGNRFLSIHGDIQHPHTHLSTSICNWASLWLKKMKYSLPSPQKMGWLNKEWRSFHLYIRYLPYSHLEEVFRTSQYISSTECTERDLSHYHHGKQWHKCCWVARLSALF